MVRTPAKLKSTQASPKPAAKAKRNPHRVTKRLTIRDRLGQLTVRAAERLLGEQGAKRLRMGGTIEIDVDNSVRITGDSLFAAMLDPDVPSGVAQVTVVEMSNKTGGLHLHCDACKTDCDHIAATLHMVLESKLALGLSEVPDPHEPIENLSPKELIARAISERQIRSQAERMLIKSTDASTPWADYMVTSQESGNSYRVSCEVLSLASPTVRVQIFAQTSWVSASTSFMQSRNGKTLQQRGVVQAVRSKEHFATNALWRHQRSRDWFAI